MLIEKAALAAILALVSATSAAAGSNCSDVAKQIAGAKSLPWVDGDRVISEGRDFVWHAGLPPEGVTRSKEDSSLLIFPTGKLPIKAYVDSTTWASIDMDGNRHHEIVVVTDFLQNMRGGYYELTSLYMLCSIDGRFQLCAEATFTNPPILDSVMRDGSRRENKNMPTYNFKIGPEVKLVILKGENNTHLIAVLPDRWRRKRAKIIADVYGWTGQATSFRLACRLR